MLIDDKKERERIRKEREYKQKVEAEYIERFCGMVAEKVVSILLEKFNIKPKKESDQ